MLHNKSQHEDGPEFCVNAPRKLSLFGESLAAFCSEKARMVTATQNEQFQKPLLQIVHF
jgi:hypothetical protein